MPERDYDIVLYGASGFTGKQAVRYLAKHAQSGTVRWAIAGRNREKLEAVKKQIGGAANDADVLVAESRAQAAVDNLVARTRVLLTTAGPFARYGSAIVDACVRLKTHYADITGETPWVSDLIERYHEQAAADGTRIIPFCGFDSVPSDLGTYLVVHYMQREFGVSCRAVKAYFQMYGGVNGGTLATAFNLYETGLAEQARDLFLLNPLDKRVKADVAHNQDPKWPQYDQAVEAWVGPFIMGPINTRVVRRSSALFEQWQAPYGASFSYQEYLKFNGALGFAKAAGLTLGTGLFKSALRTPLRHLIKPLLPQPGAGPSERVMNKGWFRCELLGWTDDGRKVRGLLRDQGDPGNRATVKFLCEAGLSLALHADELPGGPQRGGILTPATGLGDVLAKRLRNAGMFIEVGG